MPELPEVETILRGLSPRLVKATIQSAEVRHVQLRRPVDPAMISLLEGARVQSVSRRGKYIILRLENGMSTVIHLGMSGRLTIVAADDPVIPHTHIILNCIDASGASFHVRFVDPRRFGAVDVLTSVQEEDFPPLAHLGPEPLSAQWTKNYLLAIMARKTASIKSILLDQRVVAGLGNIYVCEILFRAGINPARKGRDLSKGEVGRIVAFTRQVLLAAIGAGGTTLRDYVTADGQPGAYKDLHLVYDREGLPCICCMDAGRSGTIARIVQSGRSSFYCVTCQTMPS